MQSKGILILGVISTVFVLMLNACGLKYTPPETLESFETRRHKAIEDHYRIQLKKDSLEYNSIAFGEPIVLKPSSFRLLDSLFELKYQNEKKNITDKELENKIDEQKSLVERDTAKIIYIESHVFSYEEENLTRIVNVEVEINRIMEIVREDVLSTYLIPSKRVDRYKQFLFEESFMYPGAMATDEEENFYQFYKGGLESEAIIDKDVFLSHILTLMELGNRKKTIRTSQLLLFQARKLVSEQINPLKKEVVSDIFSEYEEVDGKEIISGYWFTLSYEVENVTKQVYFKFDRYLQFLKMQEL